MTTATAQRTFAYRSRGAGGRLVKGTIDAPSEGAVVARLKQLGLAPIEVTEKSSTGFDREITIPGFSKGVKIKDLATASRQLATMVGSGLPLMRAIAIVGDQTANRKLGRILGDVAREVETGGSLSGALARYPHEIPVIMVSMVRAGETGGFLDIALAAVATTFEKEAKLRGKIKSAMTYPVVVLLIALLAVVAMLLFIVPVFKTMFEGFGKELPLPTQLLVVASDQMWWLLPSAAVVGLAVSVWWKANKNADGVRRVVHPILLRLPVFGPLMAKVAIGRFARNLSNMTSAGVPLLKALDVVGRTSGNWVVEQASNRVGESVRTGKSMAAPLAEVKIFPAMVVQMISVGEESGSIDAMLAKVADIYDEEVEATADALTSLIEPMLITVLGVVVGGMIVALYLPIFGIAGAIGG